MKSVEVAESRQLSSRARAARLRLIATSANRTAHRVLAPRCDCVLEEGDRGGPQPILIEHQQIVPFNRGRMLEENEARDIANGGGGHSADIGNDDFVSARVRSTIEFCLRRT